MENQERNQTNPTELLKQYGATIEHEVKSLEDTYRVTFYFDDTIVTVRIKLKDSSGADLMITNMTTFPENERSGGLGSKALQSLLSWAEQSNLKDIRATQVGQQSENFWIKNGFIKEEGINKTGDFVYRI